MHCWNDSQYFNLFSSNLFLDVVKGASTVSVQYDDEPTGVLDEDVFGKHESFFSLIL